MCRWQGFYENDPLDLITTSWRVPVGISQRKLICWRIKTLQGGPVNINPTGNFTCSSATCPANSLLGTWHWRLLARFFLEFSYWDDLNLMLCCWVGKLGQIESSMQNIYLGKPTFDIIKPKPCLKSVSVMPFNRTSLVHQWSQSNGFYCFLPTPCTTESAPTLHLDLCMVRPCPQNDGFHVRCR